MAKGGLQNCLPGDIERSRDRKEECKQIFEWAGKVTYCPRKHVDASHITYQSLRCQENRRDLFQVRHH